MHPEIAKVLVAQRHDELVHDTAANSALRYKALPARIFPGDHHLRPPLCVTSLG